MWVMYLLDYEEFQMIGVYDTEDKAKEAKFLFGQMLEREETNLWWFNGYSEESIIVEKFSLNDLNFKNFKKTIDK